MRSSLRFVALAALAGALFLPACTREVVRDDRDGGFDPRQDGGFRCLSITSEGCEGDLHRSCVANGEFLEPVTEDCAATGEICVDDLWCVQCIPDTQLCDGNDVVMCSSDGSEITVIETCDISMGFTCRDGACVNLCEEAIRQRSYVGCEFYAVDLDNAAIGAGRDASAQQYAVVVSNPGSLPTEVTVEIDTSGFGETSVPVEIERVTIGPGDLEVFTLPRREVDGSSSFATCSSDATCGDGEGCYCMGGVPPTAGATDCRCRNAPTARGLNDGTHSALTPNAYRIRSSIPIVAYQFNPLDNVGVFSNDASLLLPTSAIGRDYVVVSWPQTIANSTNPAEDWDTSRTDEDLRAFLTVVGTTEAQHVTITLGDLVREVVGLGAFPGPLTAGQVLDFDLGAFDVVNLETQGFNADFTGTIVTSNGGVSVFTGGEASDAPRFDDVGNRQCCADHIEEQLFPTNTMGLRFFIGRTPARSTALNAAFVTADSVGDFNEPEYVRVVAVEEGTTTVTTSIPFPGPDFFELQQYESLIIEANQDFFMSSDRRLGVVQVMASQQATGIANIYPGGDPSLIAIPPIDQYRQDYVFLTPAFYAFDFITIVAPAAAQILLDGNPLDPLTCTSGPADGVHGRDDPPEEWLVYRCQLSFPDVIGVPNVRVEDGLQNDGYHTLQATQDVSIVVSGFDAFVSYAYAGGLNLDPLM
jgi:hypothetical protein